MLMSTHMLVSPVAFQPLLAFLGLPMGMEWVVLLVLGLLIFGKRLPEVGRSLGRGIVEFKKGVRGLEDEIDDESSKSSSKRMTDAPRQELPRSEQNETVATGDSRRESN